MVCGTYALDSHTRIGTRVIVRVGTLPLQPALRPHPIKVCFNFTHEALLFPTLEGPTGLSQIAVLHSRTTLWNT